METTRNQTMTSPRKDGSEIRLNLTKLTLLILVLWVLYACGGTLLFIYIWEEALHLYLGGSQCLYPWLLYRPLLGRPSHLAETGRYMLGIHVLTKLADLFPDRTQTKESALPLRMDISGLSPETACPAEELPPLVPAALPPAGRAACRAWFLHRQRLHLHLRTHRVYLRHDRPATLLQAAPLQRRGLNPIGQGTFLHHDYPPELRTEALSGEIILFDKRNEACPRPCLAVPPGAGGGTGKHGRGHG